MKIAIVGGHHRTKMSAPFTDKSWTIWSFSARNIAILPRVDVWFELHRPEDVAKERDGYEAWVRSQPFLYMQEHYQDFPSSRIFPLNIIKARFGTQFLKNTAALLSAFAVMERPEAIGWWGIEQNAAHALGGSRLCVQHFVRLAEELGIETVHPAASRLMADDPVYGYEPEAFAA